MFVHFIHMKEDRLVFLVLSVFLLIKKYATLACKYYTNINITKKNWRKRIHKQNTLEQTKELFIDKGQYICARLTFNHALPASAQAENNLATAESVRSYYAGPAIYTHQPINAFGWLFFTRFFSYLH